jgi:flavin-dependent dehydrogenase
MTNTPSPAPPDIPSPPLLGELDAVVIGGGPAGASCALALRSHRPETQVALVDACAYDDVRVGENVSSALLPLLEHLDVRERFLAEAAHIESFAVQACWGTGTPLPQHSLRHWSGEGYLLDRQRFDPMLAEAFHQRGGRLFLSCRVDTITAADGGRPGYLLHLRHVSGTRFSLRARVLVDATGRKASLARRLGARSQQYDALLGISRHFDIDPATGCANDILIESTADGWWYSAPLPGNRLVVTLMTDAGLWREQPADRVGIWQHMLAQAPNTQARMQHAATAAESSLAVRPAHSQLLEPATGDDWLAVGDAAASFDPLSSLGIGFAIHSGCHAARAIGSALDGCGSDAFRHYRESVQQQFAAYLPSWRSYYQLERRFADAPFWRARSNVEALSVG